jgi:hypothetical protein
VTAPNPLTAYDRFVWGRIADTARAWRKDPVINNAQQFERAVRLAGRVTSPFVPGDQRLAQVLALVDRGHGWAGLTFAEKNAQWPVIACGLPAIDQAVAEAPRAHPPAPGQPKPHRPAVDGLDSAQLPYWVE